MYSQPLKSTVLSFLCIILLIGFAIDCIAQDKKTTIGKFKGSPYWLTQTGDMILVLEEMPGEKFMIPRDIFFSKEFDILNKEPKGMKITYVEGRTPSEVNRVLSIEPVKSKGSKKKKSNQ